VLANRGANGIDGVVSTVLGVALGSGGPTVGLLGDLAFLYDAGALLWAAERDVAVTLIVVDNRGGGIFSFLPQAQALPPEQFQRYWGTPHQLDLAAVASAYGTTAQRCEPEAAADVVATSVGERGVRVIVVSSDRALNVAEHDRVHEAVAEAVAAALGAAS
jgi:2-succinyl-5-enolpyruvyl-6-hydroxy-3-cyclohexene-1-carboxylate synthase